MHLDTQNKLWKIWLQKIDEPANNKDHSTNNKKVIDDEVIEVDEEFQENEEVSHDEEDIPAMIWQKYMKRNKEASFRRTAPNAQPQAPEKKQFDCDECNFKANSFDRLTEHKLKAHYRKKAEGPRMPKQGSLQYCHFWNNVGSCHFESKNGRPCKFEHKTAPRCSFDGKCNRTFCMFSHQVQNKNFLASAPPMGNHPATRCSGVCFHHG